jgi:hypothetical protein
MNAQKNILRSGFKQRMRRSMVIPLLLIFVLIFIGSGETYAQVINNIDSINYDIDIANFKGLPGGIARMPVQVKNATPLDGFLIRFTYDTTVLVPYSLGLFDPTRSQGILSDSLELTGRGWGSVTIKVIDELPDTSYNIYAIHDTLDDTVNYNAVFIQFFPPMPEDTAGYVVPEIPIKADTVGTILYFLFTVKSNVALNTTSKLTVEDYTGVYASELRVNQFSDSGGTRVIFPGSRIFGVGYFTAGEPEAPPVECGTGFHNCVDNLDSCCADVAGNNAPVVAALATSSFSITQGETVQFSVTATDVDGDVVSLRALNMPQNATFTPSNPVSGTSSVTGTFKFTPSYAQTGTFAIDFQATDEHSVPSAYRTATITVAAIDVDRLFTTSTYGASPKGGVPGATPIIFPIDFVTTKTVYGVQFDMAYPGDVVDLDSIVVTDRTPEYVVYENIGQVPDSIRVVTFGLANEPINDPAPSSAILNAYMSISSWATAGDYWVRFFDAWESTNPDPAVASLSLMTDSGVVQVDRYGDVNIDKHINVADLVNVVGYILGNFGLPPRNYATANVVPDAAVNVVDLVGIINLIFGLPVSPSPAPINPNGNFAVMRLQHDDLVSGQITNLSVNGEFPDLVAGAQLQIDYDPEAITLGRPEVPEGVGQFILAYTDDHNGRMKVVFYSHQPWNEETLIPIGISDILRLPATIKKDIKADDKAKIRLSKVCLSNANAKEIQVEGNEPIVPVSFMLFQNFPNPFNPITQIEFDINQSGRSSGIDNATLDIFNILGQRVKTLLNRPLSPGHYSVNWDATDENGRKVSTGIYFYRLEVGDRNQTKKMMLLK